MSSSKEPQQEANAVRKDRTHFLYMAVIAAVLLGIAVGFLFPDVGVSLEPLGTGFVALIKMMISPIIFCTLVLGIGSVRQAASGGKVGGLALAYFLAMSEARALTNFAGNAVATVLVSKWTGGFDRQQAERVFAGDDPFDEEAFAAGDPHGGSRAVDLVER